VSGKAGEIIIFDVSNGPEEFLNSSEFLINVISVCCVCLLLRDAKKGGKTVSTSVNSHTSIREVLGSNLGLVAGLAVMIFAGFLNSY
jgi:hypothetical protein